MKQKPLPKYYSEAIFNPIKKIDGKNQYDENKRAIRLYNIKNYEEYSQTPLFTKQCRAFELEQIRYNDLLKAYNYDYELMYETENAKRILTRNLATERRFRIQQFQKHTNFIKNLTES